MSTQEYFGVPFNRTQANAIYTDAMSRMYGLVALGVITTGAMILVGDRTGVGDVFFSLGWIGWLLMIGIMFGTLMAANAVVAKGNTALGTVLYLAFTGIEGLFLSPIIVQFEGQTIAMAFLLTGGLFVAMSAVGMTTKRDLSKLGPMLLIGLVGLIIVSLINMLLIQSGGLFLLINILLLPLFLALTVWETKQMKELAQEAAMHGDEKGAMQVAVLGSIGPVPERPEHLPHHPQPARLRLERLSRQRGRKIPWSVRGQRWEDGAGRLLLSVTRAELCQLLLRSQCREYDGYQADHRCERDRAVLRQSRVGRCAEPIDPPGTGAKCRPSHRSPERERPQEEERVLEAINEP